jgi:hypothetical protein
MPSKPKSWKQKMAAKPPHTVSLEKDFAGVPAGAKLLISCPVEVAQYLRQHVPPGETREVQQMGVVPFPVEPRPVTAPIG